MPEQTNRQIVTDINRATRYGEHSVYADIMVSSVEPTLTYRDRVIEARTVDGAIKLLCLADGHWHWMALSHLYEIQ